MSKTCFNGIYFKYQTVTSVCGSVTFCVQPVTHYHSEYFHETYTYIKLDETLCHNISIYVYFPRNFGHRILVHKGTKHQYTRHPWQ